MKRGIRIGRCSINFPRKEGVLIPGSPTAPAHIHGFEGLALLLGNKGIPFEMYLAHAPNERPVQPKVVAVEGGPKTR